MLLVTLCGIWKCDLMDAVPHHIKVSRLEQTRVSTIVWPQTHPTKVKKHVMGHQFEFAFAMN